MAKSLEPIEQPIRFKVTQEIDSPRMPQISGAQHIPQLEANVRARAGSEAVRFGKDVATTVAMPGGGVVSYTAMSRESITQSLEQARATIATKGLNPFQFGTQFAAVSRALKQAPLSTAPAQEQLESLWESINVGATQRKIRQSYSSRRAREANVGAKIDAMQHALDMHTDVYGQTPQAAEMQQQIADARAADVDDPGTLARISARHKRTKLSERRYQADIRRQAAEQPRLAHTEKLQDQLNEHISRFGNTPEAQVMAQHIAGLNATTGDPTAFAEMRRLAAQSQRGMAAEAKALATVSPREAQRRELIGEDISDALREQTAFGRDPKRATRGGSPLHQATLQAIESLQQQAGPLRLSPLASDQEKLQLLDDRTQRLIRQNAEHQREILKQEEENADKEGGYTRAQALNMGMMVRGIGGRFAGFMGGIATADPATMGSSMVASGLTTATGTLSDVALNRFLSPKGTGALAGTGLGLTALVGAQLLNGVAEYVSGMIKRGAQLRQQAGETRAGRHLALGQILAGSETTAGTITEEMRAEDVAFREANAAYGGLIPRGYRGKSNYESVLDDQREQMTKMLTTASKKYEYGGLVSVDEMLKGAGMISAAGIGVRHLARKAFGRSYVEGVSEAGLGAYATAASKATGLDMGMITQVLAQQGLGTGVGALSVDGNGNIRSAVDVVGGAVQRGILSTSAANQFGGAMVGLASQGFSFNYGSEFNYLANMGRAGITQGHIGNAAVNLLQTRSAASAKLGAGFGNILQDSAMIYALQKSGGDLSKAMDIQRSMTSEDQMRAAQSIFGSQLTGMGVQSTLGLSSTDARKLLGVTGAGGTEEGWGYNWDSALVTQRNANELDRQRQERAPSVSDENKIADLTERMEDVADTLESIARSLGYIATGM